jgi:hypothetical protein
MKPQPKSHDIPVPVQWSAQQALAVFEFVDLLRDEIWRVHRDGIQAAMRDDHQHDPRQLRLNALDCDPPF